MHIYIYIYIYIYTLYIIHKFPTNPGAKDFEGQITRTQDESQWIVA